MKRALLLSAAGIALLWQVAHAQPTAVWRPVNTQGMGFVDGLLVHPFTGDTYVRTDVGGIFKWYGAFWGNLTDHITFTNNKQIANVESFALDYNRFPDTPTIYFVAGNGLSSYLMKSEDDGQTWGRMTGWPGSVQVQGNAQWKHAGERLAVDPNDNNVLYYGSRKDGLWRSNDQGDSWGRVDTFPTIGGNGGLLVAGGLSFVLFDPSETEEIKEQIVSKNIYVGVISGGVWRSSDGGQSFCFLEGGPDTTLFMPTRAVLRDGNLVVAYEMRENIPDGAIWQYTPGDECTEGSWADKTPGLSTMFGCPVFSTFAYNAVNVHPTNPDLVAAVAKGATPSRIFYTEDFSSSSPTWKVISSEPADLFQGCSGDYKPSVIVTPAWGYGLSHPYEEVGGIAFSPIDSNGMLIATGHAMHRLIDYTADSVVIMAADYMLGLEELCVNQIITTPAEAGGNRFFTAVQDMLGFGYMSPDTVPAEKIIRSWEGNGLSIAYSSGHPTTVAIVGSDPGSPATNQKCLISQDGGFTWTDFWNTPADCEQAPWGGNIALSAKDSLNIVWVPEFRTFLGGCTDGPVLNHPRYTTDGGATWNFCDSIKFASGNFPFTLNSTSSIGKFLESDKVNGQRFYYYALPVDTTFSAQIWASTTGGATWTKMCDGCLPPTRYGQLKANPYKEGDLWFAPYSESRLETTDTTGAWHKLWHSPDGGLTWQPISGMDTVYHFGLGATADAGTEAALFVHGVLNQTEGVFYSVDGGATFADITGTANFPMGLITNMEGDLRQEGRVYIATGCRGTFYGDVDLAPLRVSFAEPLKAVRMGEDVLLTWATASEINHDRFEVERVVMAPDRVPGDFQAIGSVTGQGNSTTLQRYHFPDPEPETGTDCYRLRSLDLDGSFEYSNVACVRFDQPGSVKVFPNPSRGNLEIFVEKPAAPVVITLHDIAGKAILSETMGMEGRLTLDLSHLDNGVYLLRVHEFTERIILAK